MLTTHFGAFEHCNKIERCNFTHFRDSFKVLHNFMSVILRFSKQNVLLFYGIFNFSVPKSKKENQAW